MDTKQVEESIWGTKHKATCEDTTCKGCHPSYMRQFRRYFYSIHADHLPSCLNSYIDSDADIPTCKGCSEDYVAKVEYKKARTLAIESGKVKEVITKVYLEVEKLKDADAALPTPKYPIGVWDGTIYRDYADLASLGNYIPKELFIETLKTVTGAIVGNSLSCSAYDVNPRFYTVLIVPSQGGKGTTIKWALKFYKSLSDGYFGTLLWGQSDEPGQIVGAALCDFSSDVGMMHAAKAQSRWLQVYEELNVFMERASVKGSGQSLLAANRSLYDDDTFTMSTTAQRKEGGTFKVLNSFLAGTTPNLWANMFKGTQSTGSGIFQRLSITAHDGKFDRVGSLKIPQCQDLQQHLVNKIQQLEKSPLDLPMSPAALFEMDRWFRELQKGQDGEETGRLNIVAQKNALHMAWLRNHSEIAGSDMRGAIALAEYHLAMRKHYKPNVGENIQAQLQDELLKALAKKPMTKSAAMDKTHAYRDYGTEIAKRAWVGLIDAGLITPLEDKKTFRPTTPLEREHDHLRA